MCEKDLDKDGGVISAQRVREFAEVLTPRWVVDKMLDERLWACRSCYGIDIQYDNVLTTRERCAQLAALFDVPYFDALFIFTRNIIHGDFLFFPQIARIYDWTAGVWTTLAEMATEADND